MSNENYATISMVEKILSEIDNIFKTDTELQDFIIIPTNCNINKNPIIHINHNLGLEYWCVKHVYRYAYEKLLDARRLLKENKIPKHKRIELNKFLIGALLIQPDVVTFWNLKRELIISNIIVPNSELQFAKVVLSFKSKSNEAFAYRKWLLNRILQSDNRNNNWELIVAEELAVCEMAAEKSANNYHAWTHRTWTLHQFLPFFSSITNIINFELDFSEKWVSTHVSEHAGFHYRQSLLNILKTHRVQLKLKYSTCITRYFKTLESADKSKIMMELFGNPENNLLLKINDQLNIYKQLSVLIYDLSFLDELIQVYPDHESIWYHRRFVLYHLISLLYEFHSISLKQSSFSNLVNTIEDYSDKLEQNVTDLAAADENHFIDGEKCSKMLKYEANSIEKSVFYAMLLTNEQSFIERCCQSSPKEKTFAKRYERWLKCVLGFKFVLRSF